MAFAGRSDPVSVKDVTATSFTFGIEPGHFDYEPGGTGFVEFSVYVKNGNLFLRQRALANPESAHEAAAPEGTVAVCNRQAENLSRALGRDPAEVILSRRYFEH